MVNHSLAHSSCNWSSNWSTCCEMIESTTVWKNIIEKCSNHKQPNGKMSLLWMDQGVGSACAFLVFLYATSLVIAVYVICRLKTIPIPLSQLHLEHLTCAMKRSPQRSINRISRSASSTLSMKQTPSRAFYTTSEALWRQDWGPKVQSCLIALMRIRGKISSINWPPTTQKRLIPPSFTPSASTHFCIVTSWGIHRVYHLQIQMSFRSSSTEYSSRRKTWSTMRQQGTKLQWSRLKWSITQAPANLPTHAHYLPLFDQSQK